MHECIHLNVGASVEGLGELAPLWERGMEWCSRGDFIWAFWRRSRWDISTVWKEHARVLECEVQRKEF